MRVRPVELFERIFGSSVAFSLGHALHLDRRCFVCGNAVGFDGGLPALGNNHICTVCAEHLALRVSGYCKKCALPLPAGVEGIEICSSCAAQHPAWDNIYFLNVYQGLLEELIKELKFGHALYAASLLGGLLSKRINAGIADADSASFYSCIIPVPLSITRLKERGYNQSLEIARVLGRNLNIPMKSRILQRIKDGAPQERLGRNERLQAVRGVFTAVGDLSGQRVLLLDDVMTTGATVSECTKALLSAGAMQVDVAIAARTGLE